MTHIFKIPFILVMLLGIVIRLEAACLPIATVPVEITKSGNYCLTKDINGTQVLFTAIQITANNVTIDFQGHNLIGKHHSDVPPPSVAILANAKKYITIKNGTIRGFDGAIGLRGNNTPAFSSGHLIENITIVGTKNGITLEGDDNIIRNNRINPAKNGGGISLSGNRNLVSGNVLTGGSGMHIGDDSIVENNRFIGGGSIGQDVGIQKNTAIIGNVLINSKGGIGLTNGLLRNNTLVNPKTAYRFDKPNQIIDGGGNIPALPK